MVNIKTLLPELRKLVLALDEDLLARATSDAQIDAGLRGAFGQIEKGGRTAQPFEVWRDDYLDQVAVAWVLACVFVRFMEDNELIDECWLAGAGERRKRAEDSHELFFREHPHDTDREYFQSVFREVGKIPAAKDLFAEGKTPLWAVAPSGDAAMKLLQFWRERDAESGELKRSFAVEPGDTRFLGDLYQELSERAKKKFALLQTPVFVEEFILDRTLTPALDEFGLDQVRMIDPTCGSGHFLLGGFARLFREWCKRESNEIKAAQKALDGVWGVDINPFAVAIARFRLIVAAVQACGIKHLRQAPGWAIHLASGDSLLFGSKPGFDGQRIGIARQHELDAVPEIYAVEDRPSLQRILCQGYHVVVGNPPYITVKDKKQNEDYRQRYSTCHRKFSLGVPFTQRFWELAIRQGEMISYGTGPASHAAGYVGMITANSFMKREFGKKLIEDFFPKNDLTHILDTSGAYIPGHGTPTVILFGRGRKPLNSMIRAVLGIKGEPSTPCDPAHGRVWLSIVTNTDRPNSADPFTSTADISRSGFSSHPWSIGGGGATDLLEQIEECTDARLRDFITSIGFASFPGLDDAFVMDRRSLERKGIDKSVIKEFVYGETLRDWEMACDICALAPYDDDFYLFPLDRGIAWAKYLWPVRNCLDNVISFGGKTRKQCGDDWWGWYRWVPDKYRLPLSIAFAFVATHNHFVLDRGGKVFKQSAPIIKLPAEAGEKEHLELLGLLNSSTACFWMKQVFFPKGGDHVGQEGARVRRTWWDERYEFAGTQMQNFPLPESRPLLLASKLDELAQIYAGNLPDSVVSKSTPAETSFVMAKRHATSVRLQMIAHQEELDWQCYQLYGLLTEQLCYDYDDLPELNLGERAFEIVMARQIANDELETTWFERHGSTPITEIPSHWPDAYRQLVARRIEIIETNKEINLIERPEYKRRWNTEPWEDQEQRALKNWLLDRLESRRYWSDPQASEATLQTTAQLTDKASSDQELMQVAALYKGRADFDLGALVADLVTGESVPFLPILRYKPAGLRKRELWERTWKLQREEDAGQNVGIIPVPPKYATADFLKTDYWRLRGKLDVPKERWISYPHCSAEGDPSLLVGWAGWNHLQQAAALVSHYDARKREGWDAARLTPLLAGLDQLLPWIHQWHPEIDPDFGETAGQSYETMLKQDAHELGLTMDDIRNWEPPAKTTRAKAGRKKKATAEEEE